MNAYLVREDDGFTLIDTMMRAAKQLAGAAAAGGAPIRRIALTHAHLDHIGSLDKLRELLGADVPVLLSKADAGILSGQLPRPARGSWPKKLATRPDVLLAVPNHPHWRFPLVWMGTADRPEAVASARKLRELDPSLLAVGHGPAIAQPSAAMNAAIDTAARYDR
jgi:glyoxylase-like metal-dependent hydrolase (beta-lactamase superfamily II)